MQFLQREKRSATLALSGTRNGQDPRKKESNPNPADHGSWLLESQKEFDSGIFFSDPSKLVEIGLYFSYSLRIKDSHNKCCTLRIKVILRM